MSAEDRSADDPGSRMDASGDSATEADKPPTVEVRFDRDTWRRIERAVETSEFEDAGALLHEGALRLVGELIDEDGHLECQYDDCDRTFATVRERRGHLGSSEHAVDVPDGEFWCGYCGYGPTSWRGVNAHHGQSSHDGPPVRLEEVPEQHELLAPDDVPDHKNPELLARLYREHDGNYTEMCRAHEFDVTPGRVRHYLIEFGIHQPTSQGAADEDGPHYRDPEWLEERYEAADRNISEMHRQIEIDVPYRTLQRNLKIFDIHDPTDPPGKRHGKGGPKPSPDSESDEKQDSSTPEPDSEQEVEPEAESESGAELDSDPVCESTSEPETFDDLVTPDWLLEGSFYAAVDLSNDIDELADALGWHEHDRLVEIVHSLELEDEFAEGFHD